MFDYSITGHITSYDLHGTPDLIFEYFSVSRVVIHLLWFSVVLVFKTYKYSLIL